MSTRLINLFSFIIITAMLLFSVYLQVFEGFMPCPLCTMQRFCFGLLGILFMFGAIIKNRVGLIIINIFTSVMASFGIFFAGRQIWLQHFPPASIDECGVSLEYMMQALPLHEVMAKVLAGSTECTKVDWKFLSLNMAEWSLIWFVIFVLVSLYLLVTRK